MISEAGICCSWLGMATATGSLSFQPPSVHSPCGIVLPSTSLQALSLACQQLPAGLR